MRRVVGALFLGLFFITFVAARSGKPGCSSSAVPKAEGGGEAGPAPTPQSQARRDPPPLMAPGALPPTVKPMVLKDDASGVIFYFESDGQHVTAIDPDGSVRWHRNPVQERGMKGFSKNGKTLWPTISYAGPPRERTIKVMRERGKQGEYLAVAFTTKEFGLLDKRTGEYTSMGSD